MSDEAVCRTAPATPGLLLIILTILLKGVCARQTISSKTLNHTVLLIYQVFFFIYDVNNRLVDCIPPIFTTLLGAIAPKYPLWSEKVFIKHKSKLDRVALLITDPQPSSFIYICMYIYFFLHV